jgi:hypothetical protein
MKRGSRTSIRADCGLAGSREGIVPCIEADQAPDLQMALPLDAHAPSEARHAVARVDKPSPDLRDAVVLLTSELVTRALRQRGGREPGSVELRVWMPREVVRVEVWTDPTLLSHPTEIADEPEYDLMLLDQSTDRWAFERHGERVCAWFEIDRREPARAPHDAVRPVQQTAV